MIPKININSHFSTINSNSMNTQMHTDFMNNNKHLNRQNTENIIHSNMDSLLLVHRRKMQRRDANRRSAQLSRARKKAHLEELKIENSRLQHLVDILDSQPELIFCITSTGRITYVSERTINFIKVNFSGNEENDDDPNHISQILSQESVDVVLQTVQNIMNTFSNKVYFPESNILFSAKPVHFQDAFGHPLVGYLRCAPVHRRTPFQEELSNYEDYESQSNMGDGQSTSKKAKSSKCTSISSVRSSSNANNDCTSNFTDSEVKTQCTDQWNLTNFKLLTDCVSSFADQESALIYINDSITTTHIPIPTTIDSSNNKSNKDSCKVENIISGGGFVNTNTLMYSSYIPVVSNFSIQTSESIQSAGVAATTTAHVPNIQVPYFNEETEFVCIIRTSDAYFAQFSSQSDLYMFSSSTQLLSTASMEAHDLKPGNNRLHQLTHQYNHHQLTGFCNNLDMKHHQRAGSSNSSGSGTNLPNSSSDTNKNSTSSETGSDDNCNGSDENST